MRKAASLMYTIILICLLTADYSAQWTKTDGPYGGSISALKTYYNTKGVRLAVCGTFMGDIYRYGYSGSRWERVFSGSQGIIKFFATESKLYAGSINSLYVSEDFGTTWTKLPSPVFVVNSIDASGQNIAVASDRGSVYLSFDGGLNWKRQTVTSTELSTICLLRKDSVLYASVLNSVYASKDNGLSWTPFGGPVIFSVTDMISTGSKILAASSKGLYISDNGSNWTSFSDFSGMAVWCLSQSNGLLYASTEKGLFTSADNGVSWFPVSNMPKYTYGGFVASINREIFLTAHGSGVLHSNDNGLSWSSANDGINALRFTSLISANDTVHVSTMGVYSQASDSLNWTKAPEGLEGRDIYSLSKTNSGLFAGTDSGIYVIKQGEKLWNPLRNEGRLLNTFTILHKGADLFAGGYGLIKYTVSGYERLDSLLPYPHVYFSSAEKGPYLFFGARTAVYRTQDDGRNWKQLRPPGLFNNEYANSLLFAGETLFLGASTGEILISKDYGESWRSVYKGTSIVNALTRDGNAVFAATGTKILATTDFGESWKDVTTGLFMHEVTALGVTRSYLYAAVSGEGVWKRPLKEIIAPNGQPITANFNLSNVEYLISQKEASARIFSIQSDSVDFSGRASKWTYWYRSQNSSHPMHALSSTANSTQYDSLWDYNLVGSMYITGKWIDSDSALTLAELKGGKDFRQSHPNYKISAHLGQALVPNSEPQWYVNYISVDNANENFSIFIKAKDNSSDNSDNPRGQLPDHFQLYQNYPNPFNPVTNISYHLPASSFVQLKVYDTLGREVSALVNREQPTGEYKVQFDGTSLPSGVYIYRLKAGAFSKAGKMILAK